VPQSAVAAPTGVGDLGAGRCRRRRRLARTAGAGPAQPAGAVPPDTPAGHLDYGVTATLITPSSWLENSG
jgi:hypothetical protein